ncbi:MAG: 50S ribosomal protein L31e [Nanoarchaeota archaeon]|nr:50S ribosomal protein L31e [Nanoarchaeota archaeon]MBU4116475.1 50S ribosomal protein L31e [Nanoarchaeota archaeon]
MAKKTQEKIETTEREYIIPLREKCRVAPRYKKANKAIRTIKEFLVRHMKIRDRDLDKIKIDKYLNEAIWARGIRKPPIKIKVKAIKQGDIVKVELVDFSEKLKYKKIREGKIEQKSLEKLEKKKPVVKQEETEEKTTEEAEEKKKQEKEKIKTTAKDLEKIQRDVKQLKSQKDMQAKQPKRPVRKALAK